ncbi:MAG TPA: trimethylamine methyltransferase family protein [Alphaproteobacteria bacterium]|nr:trimethylamine methyltransferase family protein [Alphaproteobacteria bacterium]
MDSERPKRRRARPSGEACLTAPPVKPGISGGHYHPLRDVEIRLIIDAAYDVLERTGIEVMASPAREIFAHAGCRIDTDRNRVHIPKELIDAARASARSEVLLAAREQSAPDLNLGGTRVYLGTGGQAVKVMDLEGRVRESRLADNYHIGRLCDALEHIHFYMRPVVSRDLPIEAIDVNQFYACLAATPKHVMANAYLPGSARVLREMGEILAGGRDAFDRRPVLSFTCCWTVSPLRFAPESVEILDALIEADLPVVISSAPQAGATSPAALAGTLVQITAEQLSGFTYVNLKKPGFPLIMGCVPAQADLRTGAFTGGSAEFALLNAACAQIAQALKVPLYNSSGIADSKVPDAQAGFEKGLTTATAALAGSNYIHHSAGFLESLLTVAYEQYVIDNDVNGAVMRLTRGIEVNEETLSLKVIHEVCTGPGHFLGHAQTLALMNSEYLYPALFNRQTRDDWEAAGAPDARAAANARARAILAEHWPRPIPAELDRDLRRRFDILLPAEIMRPGALTAA